MIGVLAAVFQLGYSLMLVGVGAVGLIAARWELLDVFTIDLAALDTDVAATFLNQYRFLKSTELAFGLVCLFGHRSILAGSPLAPLFLAGCALGVIARVSAWIADGQPSSWFIAFAVLEALTFLLVWISIRQLPSARNV